MIISGITEDDDENCMVKVKQFFSAEMETGDSIKVKVAHRLGSGRNRPMVAKLEQHEDKLHVFKNTNKLAKKVNANDKPFFVNEQLPARVNERRIWEREIMKRNQKNVLSQLQMSFQKGKLVINGELYKPKVWAPTVKDMISSTDKDIEDWMRNKSIRGKEVRKGNCTFIGYTRAVSNHSDVNLAYRYMRTIHGKARHIVCVYRLPGILPTDEGYDDDDEFGAGRKLLYVMRNSDMYNRAFFIVRYYGGTNLGPTRFQGYKEAMMNALVSNPRNMVSGIIDSFEFNYRLKTNMERPVQGRGRGGQTRGTSPRIREDHLKDQKKSREAPTEEEWQGYLKNRYSESTYNKIMQLQDADVYQRTVLAPTSVEKVSMYPGDMDSEVSFNTSKVTLTPITETATAITTQMADLTESWASPPYTVRRQDGKSKPQ